MASASAKFVKSSVEVYKATPWGYFTKFGMDLGTGSWNLRVKLQKGNKVRTSSMKYPLKLQIYRDDYWTHNNFAPICTDQPSSSLYATTIELPADGSWSKEMQGVLEEKSQPHIWFFAVNDCEQQLGDYSKLKYEITILNSDGSHVSVEDQGLLSLNFYLAIVFFIALGANLMQTYRRFVYNEEFDSHMFALNAAICLQFISLILQMFNLSAYLSNGKGVSAFNFLGNTADELAQLTLTILLISIAEGWTITTSDFPNPEIYTAIFIFAGFLKFILCAFGHLTEDTSDTFVEHEGSAGSALLLMRLGLFAWFLTNSSGLFHTASGRVKVFISRFTLTGSLYFLSHPLVVLSSYLFQPYLRTWIITLGCVSIQMASMLALSLMFTRQRSAYNRLRTTNLSLPGLKDS